MFVSIEILAIVVSSVGVVVTVGIALFSGLAWVVRRIDSVEHRLTVRIDGVESKLSDRIDGVESKLSDRIDAMGRELAATGREITEVKIAVARLEGPRPRLILGG